jgi:CheY-like chemotaxis protein
MDEGMILDGFGNLISFRKATIFLTTNKGDFLDARSNPIGFTVSTSTGTPLSELKREEILEGMKNILSGAFISRIRMASVFEPLSYVELADIAELKIKEQAKKSRENTGLDLKSGPYVGDLFVAFSKISEDARQMENVLREHLWPRLTQVLLDYSDKRTDSHILDIQAVLPGTDRELKVLLLDNEAEKEVNRIGQDLIQVTPCSNPQFSKNEVLSHDVVLLDLDWGHGPEDGIKLLRNLRTYSTDIPVLLYTGYSDHELRTSFFKAGASGFIPKDDRELFKISLDRIRRDFLLRNLKDTRFERIDWDISREDMSLIITLSLVEEN